MLYKRGQQEMVGFVLIVVLVVIGLFVFLLFSLRSTEVPTTEVANNVLSATMKTTTDCALVYEPNYETIRDLFRSCYEGRRCANTLEQTCDVLRRDLTSILDEVLVLDPYIEAYQLDFAHSDSVGSSEVFRLLEGNCTGTVYGSELQSLRLGSTDKLLVGLRICVSS